MPHVDELEDDCLGLTCMHDVGAARLWHNSLFGHLFFRSGVEFLVPEIAQHHDTHEGYGGAATLNDQCRSRQENAKRVPQDANQQGEPD